MWRKCGATYKRWVDRDGSHIEWDRPDCRCDGAAGLLLLRLCGAGKMCFELGSLSVCQAVSLSMGVVLARSVMLCSGNHGLQLATFEVVCVEWCYKYAGSEA